jgi:hypothetical protein
MGRCLLPAHWIALPTCVLCLPGLLSAVTPCAAPLPVLLLLLLLQILKTGGPTKFYTGFPTYIVRCGAVAPGLLQQSARPLTSLLTPAWLQHCAPRVLHPHLCRCTAQAAGVFWFLVLIWCFFGSGMHACKGVRVRPMATFTCDP